MFLRDNVHKLFFSKNTAFEFIYIKLLHINNCKVKLFILYEITCTHRAEFIELCLDIRMILFKCIKYFREKIVLNIGGIPILRTGTRLPNSKNSFCISVLCFSRSLAFHKMSHRHLLVPDDYHFLQKNNIKFSLEVFNGNRDCRLRHKKLF